MQGKWFVHRGASKNSGTFWQMEKIFRSAFSSLYCTKYNEIKISYSDVQRYICYKKIIKVFISRVQGCTKDYGYSMC